VTAADAAADDHRHPIFARWWARTGSSAMSKRDRAELLESLSGRVLEVGAGDGLNFDFYPDTVASVLAVEPEPSLRARAQHRAAETAGRDITVVAGTAEALPAEDASVDAVVTCLVLCSVGDQARALAEAQRVLRPGGELRFYEHVVAHSRAGLAVQRGLDRSGIWPLFGAGCHLTRDTESAIRASGLHVERLRRFPVGLGPVGIPHIAGVARRA
jgi:ubiquinone/menaquinone biosynthesis C-methylase UbiE